MIDSIKQDLAPYYNALNNHEIYQQLSSISAIKVFMEMHVYSVWDFMNLLKYLQTHLTCTSIPWIPFRSAKLSRLINEIVLEEESDVIDNEPTSHFMYYSKAIKQIGIDAPHIDQFIHDLNANMAYKSLIIQSYIPKPAQLFLDSTYSVIHESTIHVAAAFAFGRESLVPSLFEPIVAQLKQHPTHELTAFIHYLERHIELDGDQHSHLAFDMVTELVSSDHDWEIVKASAIQALIARTEFWNGISSTIQSLNHS